MDFPSILLMATIKFVPILWLTLYALRDYLRFSLVVNVMITAGLTLLLAGSSFLFTIKSPGHGVYQIIFVTGVIIAGIFMFALLLKNFLKIICKIIFTFFMIFSIIECSVFTARLFMGYYNKNEFFSSFLGESLVSTSGTSAILLDATAMIFLVPLVFAILKNYVYPIIKIQGKLEFWKYLWVIPSSYIVFFYYLLYPGYFEVSTLSYRYMLVVSPLWIAFMIAVYVVVLKMLLRTAQNLQLQKELELTNVHLDMQKMHYELLKNNIEDMRKVEHDTRHVFNMLQGFVKNNDLKNLEKSLNISIENLDNLCYKPYCQNNTVNVIIWGFNKTISENSIELSVIVNIPDENIINAMDIAVLFGNLIENGIEACCRQIEGDKFLEIKAEMVTKRLMAISVKNSYDGKIEKNNKDFISSKRDSGEGIGLKSVNNIAHKYNGTVKIDYDEATFIVRIILSM